MTLPSYSLKEEPISMQRVKVVSTRSSSWSEGNELKRTFAGFTPLLVSASTGNKKILRILIEKGANVNATTDDGDSALNFAARRSKNLWWNMKSWTTRLFFCRGWNKMNKHDLTNLINAIDTDHVRIAKRLIENGTDINHKGAYGRTPLMVVAGQSK